MRSVSTHTWARHTRHTDTHTCWTLTVTPAHAPALQHTPLDQFRASRSLEVHPHLLGAIHDRVQVRLVGLGPAAPVAHAALSRPAQHASVRALHGELLSVDSQVNGEVAQQFAQEWPQLVVSNRTHASRIERLVGQDGSGGGPASVLELLHRDTDA